MSVMIQVRNVPERVHRVLKARAALLGVSLSDLVLDELKAMAALPAEAELRERLGKADAFRMKASSAGLVRRERDAA